MDVVERAPHLVEPREHVGGVLAERARAARDVEVVRQLPADALEERHAAGRRGSRAEPREESALVALVERVEDEVLVARDLLGTWAGPAGETRAGRVGEGRRARRDPDDIRRRLGLGRGMPERAGRVEGFADGRALGLEAFREEGVAGAELTDGACEDRFGLGEEHRRPPGSGGCADVRVGRMIPPRPRFP